MGSRTLDLGYWLFVAIVLFGLAFLIPPAAILPGLMAKLAAAPDRLVFAAMWLAVMITIIYAMRGFRLDRVAVSMLSRV